MLCIQKKFKIHWYFQLLQLELRCTSKARYLKMYSIFFKYMETKMKVQIDYRVHKY